MPKYSVLVPFTGSMLVQVEADNPEEAKEAAFAVDFDIDNVHELEMHERVVQGNVFYGVQNDIKIDLINDDEEY
jgi:hypothetical protein